MNRPAFPWLLALAFFFLRLPLLFWYRGEYTDSVLLLTLFENQSTYYPPLFPLCAWIPRSIGLDATLAGRLVSLLSTALCSVPLFHLGRRLRGPRTALTAVLLFQSAALANQWAPRAMSDALFTLLFITCLYYCVLCYDNASPARDFARLVFWTGMASLCRYQGLAFLPVLLLLAWRRRLRPVCSTHMGALLPWLALAAWIAWRGFGHGAQYAERTLDWQATLHAYWIMTWGFLRWLPYAMGYLNVLLALFGLWALRRTQHSLILLGVYLVVIWFVAHVPFQSFQFRYFLPILPLVVLLASVGWANMYERSATRFHSIIIVALMVWLGVSSAFSAQVLRDQRDAWGDLWQAAAYLRTLPPGARVYANELYANRVENYKLRFWSGREVKPLYTSWEALEAGDVVVLSSLHDDITAAMRRLAQRWDTSEQRTFTVTLIPRLGDLMSSPPRLTSTPQAMAYRNAPQRFTTIVVSLR
ncbi:glycosyltransferase family 39 protein [bacterium]|nr:glycosyltransferase family 39 protein [bacterium]